MNEKLKKFINPKIGKGVAVTGSIILSVLFGSWCSNMSWQQSVKGYQNYTVTKAVDNVLAQENGVYAQLAELKTIALQTQENQKNSDAVTYSLWVADIRKYYNWANAGEVKRLSPDFNEKMSLYWANLPASYKTDIVTSWYTFTFDYIKHNCK